MRKTLFVVVLTLLVIHSPLAQADPRELPPPVAVVANTLSLNEQQVEALIAMIQAREAAVRPIAQQLEGHRQALAALLESANPDPAAAGKLLIDIRDGERQIAEIARQSASAFVQNLGAEQRERLQFLGNAAQVAPVLPAFKAVGLL